MKEQTEFEVEVTNMIEHEDGSATIIFDTCLKGRERLISYGLLKLLEKAASEAPYLETSENEKEKENED